MMLEAPISTQAGGGAWRWHPVLNAQCSFSVPRVTSVDRALKNQGVHASSLTNPCPLPKVDLNSLSCFKQIRDGGGEGSL